tara:strand:- start:911 stop:1429 length:519 start_codon:yes stop_codon:yes gene_type:complete
VKHIIWIIFLTFSINSQNIIPDVFATNVSVFRGAELVSESLIKRRSGNMVFTLVKPYSQSIFLVDEQIYIQDDDFKQISLLKDQNSLPMLELFQNTHEFEPIECEEANCFINTSKIPGISTMVVVKNGDILEEISYYSLDYKHYKLKFSNFVNETENISYTPPDGYEFIEND